jgi:hypothetical protein
MNSNALKADWRSTTQSGKDVTIEGVGAFQGCKSFPGMHLSLSCTPQLLQLLISLILIVAAELR